MEKMQLNHAADPSVTPLQGTSPFLSLPGELRNEIYRYALSHSEGLFYKYEANDAIFKLYTSIGADREANQLKYVNRQLYVETVGLGLKFNDLTFIRTSISQLEPREQFMLFLERCADKKKDELRGIHLRELPFGYDEPPLSTLHNSAGKVRGHQIVDFCWAYPKATVNSQLLMPKTFMPQAVMLYIAACYIRVVYRGQDITKLVPSATYRAAIVDRAVQHRRNRTIQSLNAPNIRFWPPGNFDEAIFRSEWENSGHFYLRIASRFEGGLDALVNEVRGWYAYGF